MSETTEENAMTVTPEMGLQVLERAKAAIYAAFEGQGDSPASAVSTAIVGYRNAGSRITELVGDNMALQKMIGDLVTERDELNTECEAWIKRVETLSDASKLEDENTTLRDSLAAAEKVVVEEQRVVSIYREKNQNTIKAFASIRSSLDLSDPPAIFDIEEEAGIITTGIALLETESITLRDSLAAAKKVVSKARHLWYRHGSIPAIRSHRLEALKEVVDAFYTLDNTPKGEET